MASLGGRMPRYLLVLLVPRPGQVGRRQLAVQQGLLQLEADQDVQVVGGLVGLDADQRRPHLVQREIEGVQRHVAQRGGKRRWASGKKCSQKARLRPTMFSHIRDCDSWMPSDTASPSGRP